MNKELATAWETTVEDVENVLKNMGADVSRAAQYHDDLDFDAIVKAALHGNAMEEQTDYAYQEIERQLRIDGLLGME